MSDLLINAAERARLDVGSLKERATQDKDNTAFSESSATRSNRSTACSLRPATRSRK
jgi:hypothetical protein